MAKHEPRYYINQVISRYVSGLPPNVAATSVSRLPAVPHAHFLVHAPGYQVREARVLGQACDELTVSVT